LNLLYLHLGVLGVILINVEAKVFNPNFITVFTTSAAKVMVLSLYYQGLFHNLLWEMIWRAIAPKLYENTF